MTMKNVRFDSLPIWLQIWDAPFDIVCSQVAEEVGQRLGRVVKVERWRGHIVQNLYMRVKVAIPLEKSLQRGGYLLDSSGQRVWVKFRYERLPMHVLSLLRYVRS